MKNGVPWDVAQNMDHDKRLAYVVFFGEMDGNEWDWDAMNWKPQRSA